MRGKRKKLLNYVQLAENYVSSVKNLLFSHSHGYANCTKNALK